MNTDLAGVASLLMKAKTGATAKDYKFFLDGDLRQMSAQGDYLRNRGFDVAFNNVYPCLHTEEEFKRALGLFYSCGVEGWWNYREKLINYGICTKEDYTKKLDAWCEKTRQN